MADEFKSFFETNLSALAQDMERQRDKIAPHYKRFYKKLLMIAAVTLSAEIYYQIQTYGKVEFLITPMATAAIALFGSIFIGLRQNARTRKFQDKFHQAMVPKVAEYLFEGWDFHADRVDMRSDLEHCGIFDNIINPTFEGQCFLSKGDIRLGHVRVDYTTRNFEPKKDEGEFDYHSSMGLIAIKNLSEANPRERWLILPDFLEGKLGKKFSKLAEQAISLFKTYKSITQVAGHIRTKEGDPTYGKDIMRFEDEEFEKLFRGFQDKGSVAPDSLGAKQRAELAKFRNEVGIGYSMSIHEGHIYMYLPLGAFFCFSEIDVFDDVSQYKYYRRYLEDATIASQAVQALDSFH